MRTETHAVHEALVFFVGRDRCHFDRREMGRWMTHHSSSEFSRQIDEAHLKSLPVRPFVLALSEPNSIGGIETIPDASRTDETRRRSWAFGSEF
jgi:hypothetical protein